MAWVYIKQSISSLLSYWHLWDPCGLKFHIQFCSPHTLKPYTILLVALWNLTFRVPHLYCWGLYTVLSVFPTCCAGGSNPTFFFSPLLLRSSPPLQTTSPEHLTGSEGPTGANGVQKGTHSLSAASALSLPWIFHSAVESALLLFARMKVGRGDGGSGCVGWRRQRRRSEAVSWETPAPSLPVSSARLAGNMLSHILSLS